MKTERAANLHFTGTSASPGHAQGPIAILADQILIARLAGSPEQEAQALRQAMRQAAGALKSLIKRSEPETADILEIQVAMLEDDSLSEGAIGAIATGISADQAWASVLDNEIAGYQQA